jgi:hypothetical protein
MCAIAIFICWDFFYVSHLLDSGFKVVDFLTKKLMNRFPTNYLMDVMGVMYPQHWLQVDVEIFFKKDFTLLKTHYCYERKLNI